MCVCVQINCRLKHIFNFFDCTWFKHCIASSAVPPASNGSRLHDCNFCCLVALCIIVAVVVAVYNSPYLQKRWIFMLLLQLVCCCSCFFLILCTLCAIVARWSAYRLAYQQKISDYWKALWLFTARNMSLATSVHCFGSLTAIVATL